MGGSVGSLITAVTDAVGLTDSGKAQRELEEAQEKAQETDRAIANEKGARARRKQRQEAQQKNALIENMGAVTGLSGSSIIGNAQAANVTQAAVNQGQINTNEAYGKIQQADQQRISNAQNAGPSTLETVVGLAGDVAGMYVGGAAGSAGAKYAGKGSAKAPSDTKI